MPHRHRRHLRPSRVVRRRQNQLHPSHLLPLHRLHQPRPKSRRLFNLIVRVRGRSFPVRRALVQSRLALRSNRLVRLHRPRLARPLVSPELVATIAVSAVLVAEAVAAATIADAATAKESAVLSIRKQ